MARERGEDRRRREAEHPRVPEIVAGGDVGAGLVDRRLLDEANRGERRRPVAGDRGAALDVAEARLRMRGTDAERHQRAVLREARGARDRRHERRVIADEVIGRQHEKHDVVAMAAVRPQRRERDGRRRVAAEGFEQVRRAFGKLVAHPGVGVLRVKVILAVGDGDEFRDTGQRQRARRGLREQGLAVRQRHRRFRRRLARQRPQPRAGAAGKDDGNDADGGGGGRHCVWDRMCEGLEFARVYPMSNGRPRGAAGCGWYHGIQRHCASRAFATYHDDHRG